MTNSKKLRMTLVVAAVGMTSVLVLTSWDIKQPHMITKNYSHVSDTLPKSDSKRNKARDLDEVLDELNNVELKMDVEKIQREISNAMKKIDGDKIRIEMEKAMREVDIEKIKKDVESSIAKIDWSKMKDELDRVKEIDMSKLDMDMKKLEKELSKIGPEIEKSMEKAKVEIEKAKSEIKEYNDFVDGLEKDGLLKRKEGYSIQHKNGELTVNDQKVSTDVYNKYRPFLEKHKKFTINKTDDDFNIDID